MDEYRLEDYQVVDAAKIATPALLVYREVVAENIRRIGEMLGGYDRLRPHVKTHKMSQVARMEMAAGISKFKCATPKEAAMLAAVGAQDVLISYSIVGGAIEQVVGLGKSHPQMNLSVIADDAGALRALSAACVEVGTDLGVYVDLNTGMDRTGVLPGPASLELARLIQELPGLRFEGLHAYDGHVSEPERAAREATTNAAIQKAVEARALIEGAGLEVRNLIASGSPGFEFTAHVPGVDEVSPGTWVLWDTGYSGKMPGLFRWAALVLSSVISTPGPDLITLDAGSKAVSPDTPAPHFQVLGLPEGVEFVLRNEEHQVLRLPPGIERPSVGDQFYLASHHVCTTVNLWDEACVVDGNGVFAETWPIDARGH
ncbi:MAG: alanine racemase [bacterium]|nr:alanine racemase [bacterium]